MSPRPRLLQAVLVAPLVAACAAPEGVRPPRPTLESTAPVSHAEYAADQRRQLAEGPDADLDARLAESADLRTVLRTAFRRNPRILAARQAWAAAVEKAPQASSLPDPALQVLHFVDSVETRVGPQRDVWTLVQRIPFPTKLLLASDVATDEARIAGLRYSAAVRDVLVETKVACFEYAYLRRADQLVDQNVAIARRLAGLSADLYADDHALLIDVLKAQSQLAQLDYDRVTLSELLVAERTRINGLLDRPPDAPLGPPAELPFARLSVTPAELFDLAAKSREEFRIADLEIDRAADRESLAEAMRFPDLTLGVSHIRVDGNSPPLMISPDNGKDANGVLLGITIPLWEARNSAAARQARAERSAAVSGKAEEWQRTLTAIQDSYVRLTNAERLVLLYRDSLVPQAEQVMHSVEELSREDRARLGDYLEAQTAWLNFTLAQTRAVADYDQAIARLERLTGTSLTVTPAGADTTPADEKPLDETPLDAGGGK